MSNQNNGLIRQPVHRIGGDRHHIPKIGLFLPDSTNLVVCCRAVPDEQEDMQRSSLFREFTPVNNSTTSKSVRK